MFQRPRIASLTWGRPITDDLTCSSLDPLSLECYCKYRFENTPDVEWAAINVFVQIDAVCKSSEEQHSQIQDGGYDLNINNNIANKNKNKNKNKESYLSFNLSLLGFEQNNISN